MIEEEIKDSLFCLTLFKKNNEKIDFVDFKSEREAQDFAIKCGTEGWFEKVPNENASVYFPPSELKQARIYPKTKPLKMEIRIFCIDLTNKSLEDAVSELEIKMITDARAKYKDNISKVARELGLTRRGFYLKLDRYGLRDKPGDHFDLSNF